MGLANVSFGQIRKAALERGHAHSEAIAAANGSRILRALKNAPDGLTRAALVTAAGLSATSVKRGASRLIRHGLVERIPNGQYAATYRLILKEDITMPAAPDHKRTPLADLRRAIVLADERDEIARLVDPSDETVARFERALPPRVAQLLAAGKSFETISKCAAQALKAIDAELRALNVEP